MSASGETKTVTVTCSFGVEVPIALDLDRSADYARAMDDAAKEIHTRGFGEIKESIDDINYEGVVT